MNPQDLDVLEKYRKAVLPMYIIAIALIVATFLLFFANPIIGMVCMVGAILVFIFGVNSRQKEYARIYKLLMVEKPFQEAFEQCRYLPEQGLSETEVANTRLMNMGDDYHSEDYVTGYYNGVRFERADVKITETHRDSKGNSHTVTLFQGRWMIFEFNKNFRSDIQLIQSGFSGYSTHSGIFTSRATRRERVEFEDESFNRNFRCYAQDQHEAFYVLTPHFMTSIQRIASLMDGRIQFGFINNRLHVIVATGKDSLEPSVFRQVSYQKDTMAIKQEINAITTIVNQLSLDESIYK